MLIQKIVKKKFDATPHEVVHNLHFHHIGVKGIQNVLHSEFIGKFLVLSDT